MTWIYYALFIQRNLSLLHFPFTFIHTCMVPSINHSHLLVFGFVVLFMWASAPAKGGHPSFCHMIRGLYFVTAKLHGYSISLSTLLYFYKCPTAAKSWQMRTVWTVACTRVEVVSAMHSVSIHIIYRHTVH